MKNVLMVVLVLVAMFVGACAHTQPSAMPNLPEVEDDESIDEDEEEVDETEYCGGLEIPTNCKCAVEADKEVLFCEGEGVDLVNPGPGKVVLQWGHDGVVDRTATFETTEEQFTQPPEVKADKTGWTTGQKVLLGVGMGIGGALLGVGGYYLYDAMFPPTVHLKGAQPEGK